MGPTNRPSASDSPARTRGWCQVGQTACIRTLLTIINAITRIGRGWDPRPILA